VIALAVKDADGAAVGVDVGGLEIERLLDPEPRAVEDGQQGAVPDPGRGPPGARG
jgi:hypothetical protein